VIRLQVRATTYNRVKQAQLVLGDSRVLVQAGATEPRSISWDLRKARILQVSVTFEDPQKADITIDGIAEEQGPWGLLRWIFDSEPRAPGAVGLRWLPRSGKTRPSLLPNNNSEGYELVIRGLGGDAPFDPGSLAPCQCVLPVPR
jgi:hypothetical protein